MEWKAAPCVCGGTIFTREDRFTFQVHRFDPKKRAAIPLERFKCDGCQRYYDPKTGEPPPRIEA